MPYPGGNDRREMTGCSDDAATVRQPLTSPTTTIDEQSYNKLSFSWQAVDNAIQYGYVLTSPEGNVAGEGTTVYNTASFTGLLPGTEYTLSVWAFASTQSDYSTSPAFTITAATDALKTLEIPQPQWAQSGNRLTVTWPKIAHASGYTYELSGPGIDEAEAVETTDTSVTFVNLEVGDYEFTVYANSTTAGYEAKGQSATVSFTVEVILDWSVIGTVTFGYYNNKDLTYPATLSYNNATGVYSLQRWCDVDGYDFCFKVTDKGMEVIGTLDSYGYCKINTGLADPSYLNVYADSSYTTYEGDQDGGDIWICYYLPDWSDYDYMEFAW